MKQPPAFVSPCVPSLVLRCATAALTLALVATNACARLLPDAAASSPAATSAASTPAPTPEPQTQLPRTRLSAGMYQIDAQVAQTFEQRQTGLMWREQMPPQEGMLFVFEQPGVQCFWMKNTLLPLTAAFVDDDGTIVNLADMKAQTTTPHCSAKPVRYVLEMNQGWFAKKGIQVGSKIKGAPFGW